MLKGKTERSTIANGTGLMDFGRKVRGIHEVLQRWSIEYVLRSPLIHNFGNALRRLYVDR